MQNRRTGKHLQKVIQLSIPAVMAEISSIAMQYIDAAMVGSLGADATGAIGLVTSTTWLFGGFCIALATCFSVQVAHLTGAKKDKDARGVLRQCTAGNTDTTDCWQHVAVQWGYAYPKQAEYFNVCAGCCV